MAQKNENDLALLIGVRHYPFSEGALGDRVLPTTPEFKKVKTWLLNKNGGNIPKANCNIIKSARNGASISKDIEAYFNGLVRSFQTQGKPIRRFYFYFSGHGCARERDDTLMILPDWNPRSSRHASISSREILMLLLEMGIFSEIVMWLDCCRTKNTRVLSSTLMSSDKYGEEQTKGFLGLATHFRNQAFIKPIPSKTGRYVTVYTKVLLDGLVTKEVVDTHDLAYFLRRHVPPFAKELNLTQCPEHFHIDSNKHDILFRQPVV